MNKFSINSRSKEENKKPFIIWGGLLVLSIAWIAIIIVPNGINLLNQKKEIRGFEQKQADITRQTNELRDNLENAKQEFKIKGANSIKEENRLLPNNLNIETISKSFEIYSLLSSNSSLNNTFEISNLSFGSPKNNDELNVQELSLNITFTSTEQEARNFIKYLQSNVLPINITNGAEINLKNFIKNNPLPLSTIQTIDFSENTEENLKEVTLQINLYGKPSIAEE